VFALDRYPLIDQSFSFPWNEFSTEINKTFGCDISITPKDFGWKPKDDLFKEISAPLTPIAVTIPGISGQLLVLISHSDIERLMAHVLHIDIATLLKQDPSFFDQFVIFLSTELIACTQEIPSLKALSPRLTTRQETESAGCLCQDIDIQLQGEKALSRLIITPEFLESWKTNRMGDEPKSSKSSLSEIDINVCVEAGRTFLTPDEISTLQEGDFLLIDHPFFIPGSPKARVFLTHNGHPLFRAKVQEGDVKILEMPLQHEAFLPIGGFSMSTKEALPQKISEHPQMPPKTKSPLYSPEEMVSHDSSEENPFEEEEPGEQEEDTLPMTENEAHTAAGISSTLSKEPIDIHQLPLTVVVELTELTMSIDKLTSLQPGNLLNLDIRPENGVMLVVNGKIFGQGELVLIGDNVGVRIKEIGFQSQAS
jgi:flagellar motor switch protein FliN/FliY